MINEDIVTCRNGWETLYRPILNKIMEHDVKQKCVESKIGVEKVKEKYGTLLIEVVNAENLTDEISQMITSAERNSMNICEFCGTSHNVGVTMNFRYKTCCRYCWENHVLKNEPLSVWMDKSKKKTFKKELKYGQ